MKIFIATPSYDGRIHSRYVHSLLATINVIKSIGHTCGFFSNEAEGGVAKSRDKLAKAAIDHNFTHLLFIDADQVWTADHITNLIQANKPLIGGTYPYRGFPLRLNFNPLEKDISYFVDGKTQEAFAKWKASYTDPIIEVKHIPTGFMMIDCEILQLLTNKVEKYLQFDAQTMQPQALYEFFPMRLQPQRKGNVEFNIMNTEDWTFCEMAREAGYKVWLDTRCVVDHIGSHQYGF